MRVERVKLLPLHKNQQKIFDSIVGGQRYTIADCGRRFGKSYIGIDLALEYAINQGKNVWWVVPSSKVASKHWTMVKDILAPHGHKPLWTSKNEVERNLKFRFRNADGSNSWGELTFRSAEIPENLRGDGLDLIIYDEAAYINPIVFTTLAPSLIDKNGQEFYISTPNILEPLNHFYQMYMEGLSGDDPNWRSWHFTSYDNPFLDPSRIDDAKKKMSEIEFRIEHMAEFVDSEGRVFRNIEKIASLEPQLPRVNGIYSFGIDFGRKNDATVISIIDLVNRKQVFIDRFTKTGWELQRSRIIELYKRWKPIVIWAEENSAQVLLEGLQAEGLPIKMFYTSALTKGPMIEALSIAFEKEAIQILSTNTAIGKLQASELKVYEMKPTRAGMAWAYGAPKGFHDDTVMALALAYQAIKNAPSKIEVSENPFFPPARKKNKKPERRSMLDRYKKKRLNNEELFELLNM